MVELMDLWVMEPQNQTALSWWAFFFFRGSCCMFSLMNSHYGQNDTFRTSENESFSGTELVTSCFFRMRQGCAVSSWSERKERCVSLLLLSAKPDGSQTSALELFEQFHKTLQPLLYRAHKQSCTMPWNMLHKLPACLSFRLWIAVSNLFI